MIRLIRPTVETFDAAIESDDALEEALGVDVVPGWATFTEALPAVRETVAANPANPWGPRLFVTEVIAHTLPEHNASNRVLEKLGFRFAAETREGEQAVWRFSSPR